MQKKAQQIIIVSFHADLDNPVRQVHSKVIYCVQPYSLYGSTMCISTVPWCIHSRIPKLNMCVLEHYKLPHSVAKEREVSDLFLFIYSLRDPSCNDVQLVCKYKITITCAGQCCLELSLLFQPWKCLTYQSRISDMLYVSSAMHCWKSSTTRTVQDLVQSSTCQRYSFIEF